MFINKLRAENLKYLMNVSIANITQTLFGLAWPLFSHKVVSMDSSGELERNKQCNMPLKS